MDHEYKSMQNTVKKNTKLQAFLYVLMPEQYLNWLFLFQNANGGIYGKLKPRVTKFYKPGTSVEDMIRYVMSSNEKLVMLWDESSQNTKRY